MSGFEFKISFLMILFLCIGQLYAQPKPSTLPSKEVQKAQEKALKALVDGNKKYVNGSIVSKQKASGRWKKQQTKQEPKAMVLSCSDSRVPVEEIFGMEPGDLYVNRVAGEAIDEMVLGSLEYGAEHLNIPVLVVLGHQSCGAVKGALEIYGKSHVTFATMNQEKLFEKLKQPVKEAMALKYEGDELLDQAVRLNAKSVRDQILEKSPLLWQLTKEGKLLALAAYYSLKTGKMEWLED